MNQLTADPPVPTASRRSRLLTWLPSGRNLRAFALAEMVDSIGTGLYLVGAAVFCLRAAGLTGAQTGLGMTVAGLVGFLAAAPVGALGERINPQRLLRLIQIWRGLWFAALAFTHGLVPFTAINMAIALGTGAVVPLSQSIVGSMAADAERTKTLATIRSIRNVGFSLGALAAAPLIAVNTVTSLRGIVLGDAASFALSAFLLGRMRIPARLTVTVRNPWAALARFRDRPYARLAVVNGLLSLHMSMLSVGIPIWVLKHTRAPASLLAVLVTVNTVMAIAFQVPIAARAGESAAAFRRIVRYTGLVLAGCCGVLLLAAKVDAWAAAALLVAAIALLTFGEIWQAIVGWELSYRYADPEQRVLYLSIFSLGGSAQQIIGPALLTAGVIRLGTPGWLALALVFAALPAALAGPAIRTLDRRVEDRSAQPAI
ncbi:hypothetical protein KDL01_15355 [Actinospica durhamensis]|uniref:MFS transporter n=1 Tax=Actinospica durhamensis TaxID=1508375 RepID=A0A941ELJ8_9ACTN|nr:MFS transporter [Actinospica durhamensis]MBR7834650.1 hypothetical protein [Actinospica durhamensis]